MTNADNKFWPYRPKVSIVISVILAIAIFIVTGIIRSTVNWPSDDSTNTILIGILVISLLPVMLAIFDVIISKGGSIGYKDFKIDFGRVQQSGISGFTIPANIGMPGAAVTDSGTSNILEILRQATSTGIVVVDLEDGHAWWETRLLVLVAGAQRLRKPDKIVFVANEEGKQRIFQGWAEPGNLLQQLLKEDQQYLKLLYTARAAAMQWELFGPLEMIPPNTFYQIPAPPVWMQSRLALNHSWMAFSTQTGFPNELLAEQYLQNELGNEIEQKPGGSKHINIVRLNEIFKPVLLKHAIDMTWANEKQINSLFSNQSSFIALTENDSYAALVSKEVLFNEALKNIFDNHAK